jgi:hypothetical protein
MYGYITTPNAIVDDLGEGLVPGNYNVMAPPVRHEFGKPSVSEHDVSCLREDVVAIVAGIELKESMPPIAS